MIQRVPRQLDGTDRTIVGRVVGIAVVALMWMSPSVIVTFETSW